MNMGRSTTPGRMVFSLHDVAPPFHQEICEQLGALADAGVTRRVLNVVPNWHGSNPLSEAPDFVDLLQSEGARGSELALHGYQHTGHGAPRGSLQLRLRASLFARDASEFARLDPTQAEGRVQLGLVQFEQAGLSTPTSFCAPGWLLAPDLLPVLRDSGLSRVIGMFSLRDLKTSQCWCIPSTGHMGAGWLHESGIRLLNGMSRRILSPTPVVSLYLHPQQGVRSPAARRVLAEAAKLVAEGWEPVTYKDVALHLRQ